MFASAGSVSKTEDLIVPPLFERVASVRDMIDSMGLDAILGPERVFDLKVAVSEAVANAVEHTGNPAVVRVSTLDDRVVVDIGSEGCFKPALADTADACLPRGLGLSLMVSLADEVAFSGSRRGRTNIELVFVRPPAIHMEQSAP